MKKIKVIHERDACIGCGSCVLLDPKHRSMDDADGKSCLRGAVRKGTKYMVSSVDTDEIESVREAASACPMQIIHLSA